MVIPVDCEAFSVNAHAHYIGKRMEMTATYPDGRKEWLLKMSDWDFAWQEDYSFKEPKKLPKGTKIDVLMSYDNSAQNPMNPNSPPERISWGPTSSDEMGTITLAVMLNTEEEKKALHMGLKRKLLEQLIDRVLEGDMRNLKSLKNQVSDQIAIPEGDAIAGGRKRLMMADFDQDGKLNATEKAMAVEFMLQSGMIDSLGSVGFD